MILPFRVIQEFEGIPGVALDVHQPHQPLARPYLGRTRGFGARRGFGPVLPVGGGALARHQVHFLGADLDLDRQAVGAVQDGVQGLVAVGFRQGDVVLEAPGLGRIERVHGAQCQVAVGFAARDDAEGEEVGDFRERLVARQHGLVDAVG